MPTVFLKFVQIYMKLSNYAQANEKLFGEWGIVDWRIYDLHIFFASRISLHASRFLRAPFYLFYPFYYTYKFKKNV
jgi:hypothetical protein